MVLLKLLIRNIFSILVPFTEEEESSYWDERISQCFIAQLKQEYKRMNKELNEKVFGKTV